MTTDNDALSLPAVDTREVTWPSSDGRWTIHGWLLLPRRGVDKRPPPLLVYAEGGPMTTQPLFRIGGWTYPIHGFLANGIAILIPNSRGRAGYGVDFERAWETERDCGRGPLDDDLAGIDFAITAGLVDPDRIALAGHSWGGYLAAYALTHTTRFRAVLIHEAVSLNAVDEGFWVAGSSGLTEFSVQLGKGVPFPDHELARLQRLSPVFEVGQAATPALLEFGADGLIKEGVSLFQGLRFYNRAPTELISYPRTGHVTDEPALRYDAARRELEWFAYWVLGKPTERMSRRYGAPPIAEWRN